VDPKRMARYARIYEQLRALIKEKSPTCVAAMATICAVLHAKMPHHSWTGFYFVAGDDELHVGPYQGPVACQILKGQGVCLEAVRRDAPIIVADVDGFPGHIACDARSRSELVVPIHGRRPAEVVAVFDVDSTRTSMFGEKDIAPLEEILSLLRPLIGEGR